MGARFEELGWRATPMGEISLRRRREPALQVDVYEVKLDDEFLMSSLFTVAEVELARLGLAAASGGRLAVLVGGLGLGYTARAALEDERVGSLVVVEALEDVIGWHESGVLPLGPELTGDPRCSLHHGDFFALAATTLPGAPLDVLLLDVDHSPAQVLHPSHAAFYTPDGLARVAAQLRPGGVFALWSDEPPDEGFVHAARQAFGSCEAHVVRFANPLTGGESANTVYVATVPA